MALIDDLKPYWKLNEESGNRADSVGSNTLTDVNTVLYGTGKVGNCASFVNASDEYLAIADNPDVSTGDVDFTIAGWVYLDNETTTQVFWAKNSDSSGDAEYLLYYDQGSDDIIFQVYRATDAAVTVIWDGTPTLGTWYFIVVWHDAAADTIYISVNNSTPVSQATGGALQASGAAQFRIGAWDQATLYDLDGDVDELGLWKRVLTAAERTRLYNGGNGLTYPFGIAKMVTIF